MNNERRDIKPDAQACDTILIETVPRYKESELSGDEWRISASIKFIRKGQVVKTYSAGDIEYACRLLDSKFIDFGSGGGGYYGGERDICDQEGCSERATVKAKKKFDYCRDGHQSTEPSSAYRLFCRRHSQRGDCGLDDSDRNYEFSVFNPQETV